MIEMYPAGDRICYCEVCGNVWKASKDQVPNICPNPKCRKLRTEWHKSEKVIKKRLPKALREDGKE